MTKLTDNQTHTIELFNKASFAIEAAAGTLRTRSIKMFNILDLKQSEAAIQSLRNQHMTKAELKAGQQVPSFEATRKCINRILANKDTAIEWNAKHDLTLKTDKATGIVSFTAKVPTKKQPDNTAPANIESVASESKELAKSAGASFDDRMSALLIVASDLGLNAEDIITEYFDGLTTPAKTDCIKTLSSMIKPSTVKQAASKAA